MTLVILIEVGVERRPAPHAAHATDEVDVVAGIRELMPQPVAVTGKAGLGFGDRVAQRHDADLRLDRIRDRQRSCQRER